MKNLGMENRMAATRSSHAISAGIYGQPAGRTEKVCLTALRRILLMVSYQAEVLYAVPEDKSFDAINAIQLNVL